MQVGILTVPYITTPKHLELAITSLESFVAPGIKLLNMAVSNKITLRGAKETLQGYYDIWIDNVDNNLSRAWNIGISSLLEKGCDYVVVPNLDVELRADTITGLVTLAKRHPEAVLWSATECDRSELRGVIKEDFGAVIPSLNFSCFMAGKKLFERVGEFDEQFQVYHGDNDMHRRVILKGEYGVACPSIKFWHFGSASIRESHNPEQAELEVGSSKTREAYIAKHGGNPGEEKYEYPYNDPSLSWTSQEQYREKP